MPKKSEGSPMTLPELLERFERDAKSHMTSGPSGEEELLRTERALGHPLPGPFRTFLARLGGGIFYDSHEIFGGHRVQIHDIELVPSLLSMREQLGSNLPLGLLPFHRADGVVHALDLRGGAGESVPVVSLPAGPTFPDLPAFLTAVVVKTVP